MEIPTPRRTVEVDDLDGRALRDAVAGNTVAGWAAARDRYVLAYQWCITHPPTAPEEAATTGDTSLPGLRGCDLRVGADGTPGVAGFAVEEYAVVAGTSVGAGVRVLSDTLDLHHRYPRLWGLVEALVVPAWKAARVAELTHGLSRAAAAWIDDRLDHVGRYGWPTIEATIKQATAIFHPELLQPEGAPGRAEWDVRLDHGVGADGTSELTALGDSVDLVKFHDLVCDEAAHLKALGDTDTLGQRKARALGVLADRQATLDLDSTAPTPQPAPAPAGAGGAPAPVARPRSYLKTRLFLHLTLTDLAAHRAGDPARVGQAGFLGPQLVAQIEEWLAACGADARVTPVIDLNRAWAVDQHDPPARMRDQVVLRDGHCVFPYCTRDARGCDLDHINPYDPTPHDQGGPPGQTRPDNLAPLCRRHHRMKTFSAWTYERDPGHPRAYLWTSPHRERWRVTPREGTVRR